MVARFKTMKWKNCSLDLEQFNCPAADTYLFLGHYSPVFDLVCNGVTARPICDVQALNESGAAPKLDRMLGDEALGPFDSFAVVSTNERFESYDMPVVADEVGAVICHPKSPLPDGLIVCLLFRRSQKGPKTKIPYDVRRARDLLIEFVGGEPGEQLRDQFA